MQGNIRYELKTPYRDGTTHIINEICEVCKGPAKVITCITDPVTINKLLNHLLQKQGGQIGMLPASRAPPVRSLID